MNGGDGRQAAERHFRGGWRDGSGWRGGLRLRIGGWSVRCHRPHRRNLRRLREPVDRASRAAVELRDLPGFAPEDRPRLETILTDLGQVSGALATEEQGLSRRILADEGRRHEDTQLVHVTRV